MRIDGMLQSSYTQLASMQRINSAADDPAGLAISQELDGQIGGYGKATENALTAGDLANTAEGALSSIQDNLQRIRELAVQAGDGILTDDDRKIIQNEIDQLKGNINDVSQYTEFNTQKILDGTFVNKNLAINPSGTGMMMNVQNAGAAALGIAGFDVTGSFDISDIDNALDMVSGARSSLGSVSNRLSYAAEVNQVAEENLTAANSQITDLDPETAILQMNMQQVLQQYQTYAQQQNMKMKGSMLSLLG